MQYAAAPAPAAHAPAAAPAAPVSMPSDPAAIVAKQGEEVKSPMVGTVYLQASPEAPPFISVGDKVKKGQTLLIVEAMKTMNPIQSPRDGVVVEVLVGDAQPVEFGEALVLLEA
jgi:acetyl-CoA carboxylase biotin carboxyl carrier protein